MSDEPKRFNSVIEMLTHDCHKYALENASLKADAQVILKHLVEASSDCARLKAEVERLQQEKNELAAMIHPVSLKGWIHTKGRNAAKKGKQS